MDKFFDFSVNRNNNLYNFVDRYGNFNRNNSGSFDFNNSFDFNYFRNNPIDFYFSRYFNSSLNNFL